MKKKAARKRPNSAPARKKRRPAHGGDAREFVMTGIEGFDGLLQEGIPKGTSMLVSGGAGSGKTIFTLQLCCNLAQQGKKCLYMSFEESEKRLLEHMTDFGWDPRTLERSGKLVVRRMSPFEIARGVDAMLAKEKGELLIDIDPIILPEGFVPDIIIIDSVTAVASVFTGRMNNYRVYIDQLFRFFERMGATVFVVTETHQTPTVYSPQGVEEFLADGVIVLYNMRHGNIRERAIEILKLRGAKHMKKIVAMEIGDKGIEVYPDQEVFSLREG